MAAIGANISANLALGSRRSSEASPSSGADAQSAATALEAYFLRQLFNQVRTQGGGAFGGGFAADTFHEMLNESLADAMSKAGGFGLAREIAPSLEAMPGSSLDRRPALGSGLGSGLGPERARMLHPVPQLQGVAGGATRALRAYASDNGLSASPVSGGLSSAFGSRADPIDGHRSEHQGVDLAAAIGTPVVAAGPGVVVSAGDSGGYGQRVVVDHGDGLETRYAHLARIDVKPGDRLNAGQRLGEVGSTGRTTGPHLHFEVRRQDRAIDPDLVIPGLKFRR